MFDQPQNPNPIPQAPQAPAGAGAPPPMPPAGRRGMFEEPEDILGDVDVIAPARPAPPRQATPAFGGQRPAPSIMPNPLSAPAVLPPISRPARHSSGLLKKVILIIVGLLVLGGLSAGAYFGYIYLSRRTPATPSVNGNTNARANTNTGAPANTNANQANVNSAPIDQTPVQPDQPSIVQPEIPLDADKDGLSDEEERLYGTNANNSDTDNDGLTDRDEVKVFKTDPNNPDTDGDTYIDGKEVKAGYDPKGPGKLLPTPTPTTTP